MSFKITDYYLISMDVSGCITDTAVPVILSE